MAYTPKKINDTTQIPEDITFSSGSGTNIPFGTTIPSTNNSSAISGLDASQVQIIFDTSLNLGAGGLAISPIGQTTYTVTII